jgi:vacuolar-type H+-ATPase subunit H
MKKIRTIKRVAAETGPKPVMKRAATGAPATRPATDPIPQKAPLNVINTQQMILNAQRELELARRLRMQAQRYLQETEIKARSEAQRLILQTRLAIRKEIEEVVSQANEEIQKVLADIRVIRITAQEELAAQKKFTDAARLRSFTLSLQEEEQEPKTKPKKRVTTKKPTLAK